MSFEVERGADALRGVTGIFVVDSIGDIPSMLRFAYLRMEVPENNSSEWMVRARPGVSAIGGFTLRSTGRIGQEEGFTSFISESGLIAHSSHLKLYAADFPGLFKVVWPSIVVNPGWLDGQEVVRDCVQGMDGLTRSHLRYPDNLARAAIQPGLRLWVDRLLPPQPPKPKDRTEIKNALCALLGEAQGKVVIDKLGFNGG